jgi:hypothetical protein
VRECRFPAVLSRASLMVFGWEPHFSHGYTANRRLTPPGMTRGHSRQRPFTRGTLHRPIRHTIGRSAHRLVPGLPSKSIAKSDLSILDARHHRISLLGELSAYIDNISMKAVPNGLRVRARFPPNKYTNGGCMRVRERLMATICLLLLAAAFGAAQSTPKATSTEAVPRLIKFGGIIKDDVGHLRTGVVGATFAIYREQQGGAPLWLETQNVQADNKGNYTALLGSTKAEGLPAELFASNEARWLGVQVEGQAEQPRVLLVSVPYALKAADAETIGGLPASAFVRANSTEAIAADAPPSTGGSISGAATGAASQLASKTVPPPAVLTVNTPAPGDPASFVPLWTGTSPTHTLGSSALFQLGTSQVGLNTKTPGASLEIDSKNQLGVFVNAPFSGVGAGLDFNTTGTGGKGWEILATGKTAAQGPSRLNIRDLSTATDVLTIAPGGRIGIGTVKPTTPLDVEGNLGGSPSAFVMAVGNSGTGGGLAVGTNGTNQAVNIANTNSGGGVAITSGGLAVTTFSPALQASALNGGPGVFGEVTHDADFAVGVRGEATGGTRITMGAESFSASSIGIGALGQQLASSGIFSAFLGRIGAGVWGDSAGTGGNQVGVVGTADDAIGVGAHTNGAGSPALYAQNDAASGALIFDAIGGSAGGECSIDVSGNLHCTGTVTGAAAVSGTRKVALYAVEAAENWFEDAGSGRLLDGAVTVPLDPIFSQTINSSADYHVFLTPEGDCRGLYVSNKSAKGFEVHELGGGASRVAFAYRIMARRKGYESVRLQDVAIQPHTRSLPLRNSMPVNNSLHTGSQRLVPSELNTANAAHTVATANTK